MTPQTLQEIAATIRQVSNQEFTPRVSEPIYGGDINRCFLLADTQQRYFLKTNAAQYLPMLQTEHNSLQALRAAKAMAVPEPIALGSVDDSAFLVLEYCPMGTKGSAKALAEGLVKLHRQMSADGRFGWHEDNFIGTTPQHNQWHSHWPDFWWEQRLLPQLELAYSAGYKSYLHADAQKLEMRLPDFWGDYQPEASLLHGDLWGGNAGYLESGEPVIYDPASYYGDRETDLAMTELFGGFTPEFYREYRRLWPLEPGYEQRKPLYNLYHLLNHLNLFGGAYLSQCQAVVKQLLASP